MSTETATCPAAGRVRFPAPPAPTQAPFVDCPRHEPPKKCKIKNKTTPKTPRPIFNSYLKFISFLYLNGFLDSAQATYSSNFNSNLCYRCSMHSKKSTRPEE